MRCSSGPIRSSFARTALASSMDTTPRWIRFNCGNSAPIDVRTLLTSYIRNSTYR